MASASSIVASVEGSGTLWLGGTHAVPHGSSPGG
jgi:hypothetical protein